MNPPLVFPFSTSYDPRTQQSVFSMNVLRWAMALLALTAILVAIPASSLAMAGLDTPNAADPFKVLPPEAQQNIQARMAVNDAAAAYPLAVDPVLHVSKLFADDGAGNHHFGWSVASDGDTVVVGAILDDDKGEWSGSAYIFQQNPGGTPAWIQVAKLIAHDGAATDYFGHAVAIHGDTAVVGAFLDDDQGSASGSVYLYYRDQGGANNWGQVTKLRADDGAYNYQFGLSVAIDGDTVAVGAPYSKNNGSGFGSAYIYYRDQGGTDAWGQVAKISADDTTPNGQFGYSVAMDGDRVAVGAYYDIYGNDCGYFESCFGSAYIYYRDQGGIDAWGQVAKLTADDGIPISDSNSRYTSPVAISDSTVVLGAEGDDDNGRDAGAAYIMAGLPGVTINPAGGLLTTEAGGSATFTVALDSNPYADVTIDLSCSDTSECELSGTRLDFNSDNWSTAQAVTVAGVDDDIEDGHQAFTVVLSAATSTGTLYDGLDVADVSMTNLDDESFGILVSPTSGLTTTEAGDEDTFTVVLTSEPVADVIIDVTPSNPNEGTVSPASLTFTAGNWGQPQTVTVTGADDGVQDGDQTYTILTTVRHGGDPLYNSLDPDDVSVTNQDDDTADVLVSPTSGLVTSESGISATFTVVLISETTADVIIDVTSSNPNEGTVSPASLTFTASDWDQPRTVTVTGVDDGVDDGDQAYTVATSACTSIDPAYSGMDPADVSVINVDSGGTSTVAGSSGGGGGCFIMSLKP